MSALDCGPDLIPGFPTPDDPDQDGPGDIGQPPGQGSGPRGRIPRTHHYRLPIGRPKARTLRERWRTRNHIGPYKPQQRIFVREGHYVADVVPFPFDDVQARVHNVPDGYAFMNRWEPTGPYKELPQISECQLDQNYDNNGVCNATITVENTVLVQKNLGFGDYHEFDRGFMAPLRGFRGPDGSRMPGTENEWARMLERGRQITVVQGYGDILVPTFTGLIDDADLAADPTKIQIVARDFGGSLIDRRVFGNNIGGGDRVLKEPVTFASRAWYNKQVAEGMETNDRWVLVDDASDIVKTVLQWSGFGEWEVESVGANLQDNLVFNRSNSMMDVITRIKEMVNYVFFMRAPTGVEQTGDAADLDGIYDNNSLGVPVFRENRALYDLENIETIQDRDLLTEMSAKFTAEPLSVNIRVRGRRPKDGKDGRGLGMDSVKRYMDWYQPPHTQGRGHNKHHVHHDEQLASRYECAIATRMVAVAQALKSTTATLDIPAYPFFDLDDHLLLVDRATSLRTRVWIAQKQSTLRQGETGTWVMTIGGALIDSWENATARSELLRALHGDIDYSQDGSMHSD